MKVYIPESLRMVTEEEIRKETEFLARIEEMVEKATEKKVVGYKEAVLSLISSGDKQEVVLMIGREDNSRTGILYRVIPDGSHLFGNTPHLKRFGIIDRDGLRLLNPKLPSRC